eukprot:6231776-Pyramimonas_sp.AAC.1
MRGLPAPRTIWGAEPAQAEPALPGHVGTPAPKKIWDAELGVVEPELPDEHVIQSPGTPSGRSASGRRSNTLPLDSHRLQVLLKLPFISLRSRGAEQLINVFWG